MDANATIQKYFQNNHSVIEKRIIDLVREMVKQRTVNVVPEKLSEHPYLKFRGEEYRVAEIAKGEFDRIGIPFDEFARNDP